MFYVYILRSTDHPNQTYVGFSKDLRKRLKIHNEGGCAHTSKFKPWIIEWYCAFENKHQATQFETYLKSHSGKAFANKHLLYKATLKKEKPS